MNGTRIPLVAQGPETKRYNSPPIDFPGDVSRRPVYSMQCEKGSFGRIALAWMSE